MQGPDTIAIGLDTGQGQGFQRVVYVSGSHPSNNIQFRHGDSRGHFEGNVLVVETTNFSPKYPFRGAAENLKLVERSCGWMPRRWSTRSRSQIAAC